MAGGCKSRLGREIPGFFERLIGRLGELLYEMAGIVFLLGVGFCVDSIIACSELEWKALFMFKCFDINSPLYSFIHINSKDAC